MCKIVRQAIKPFFFGETPVELREFLFERPFAPQTLARRGSTRRAEWGNVAQRKVDNDIDGS